MRTSRSYPFSQLMTLIRQTDTNASQTLPGGGPGLLLDSGPGATREIVVGEHDAAAWITMSTRPITVRCAVLVVAPVINVPDNLTGLGLGIPRSGERWLADEATGVSDYILLAADFHADRWVVIVGRANEGTSFVTALLGVAPPSTVSPSSRAALKLEHHPGRWALASVNGVPGALILGAQFLPDFDGFGGETGVSLFAVTGAQTGTNAPNVTTRFQDLSVDTEA